MTLQEAAAKVHTRIDTVKTVIGNSGLHLHWGDGQYHYYEGKIDAYSEAEELISQITLPTPQPWPPPENLKCVLGFDVHSQTWMKVTLKPFDCLSYSHWLPMPEKPGVEWDEKR